MCSENTAIVSLEHNRSILERLDSPLAFICLARLKADDPIFPALHRFDASVTLFVRGVGLG